ncbi:MAG: hypothetical protein EPO28_00945 [Saprospiraceae bacterium]|nr:MAG: hypothetical protein EPO28_00945 [Saprospiraceae bacterium]
MSSPMNAKILLEKYFEGKTTLEEEARLREYFNQNEVEEFLKPYQPLFQFFEHEKKLTLGSGFGQKLLAQIESPAKLVPIRNWRRTALRIAAVAVVLIAAFMLLKPHEPKPHRGATIIEITNPDMAYEETVEALRFLSSKLNKGKEKTEREVAKANSISKYFN